MAYINFKNITKEYIVGEKPIRAVDDASFTVEKGEFAIILGASGAGKTTALNILGGMDVATSGHISVDGRDITEYTREQLAGYRPTFFNVSAASRESLQTCAASSTFSSAVRLGTRL